MGWTVRRESSLKLSLKKRIPKPENSLGNDSYRSVGVFPSGRDRIEVLSSFRGRSCLRHVDEAARNKHVRGRKMRVATANATTDYINELIVILVCAAIAGNQAREVFIYHVGIRS